MDLGFELEDSEVSHLTFGVRGLGSGVEGLGVGGWGLGFTAERLMG